MRRTAMHPWVLNNVCGSALDCKLPLSALSSPSSHTRERPDAALKRLPIFSFAFAAPAAGRNRALASRCVVPGRHRLNWQLIGIDNRLLARSGRSPQPPCNSFRSDLMSSGQLRKGCGQGRHSRSDTFKLPSALRVPCGLFCWTDLPSTCHTAVVRRGPVGMTCV